MSARKWTWLPATKRLVKSPEFTIDQPLLGSRALSLRDAMNEAFGRDEEDSFLAPRGSLRRVAAERAAQQWRRLFLG